MRPSAADSHEVKTMARLTCVTDALFEEAVSNRRHIHAHPEVGFDLEETVAFVRERLAACGIEGTDRFGRCSLSATIGDVSGRLPIVALRADMDALPIQEASGVPFASQVPGRMHACGHDAHSAVLLAVAKILKEREADLPCGVRLIFQPSEECAESGARMMVENGVLDGVTAILGAHCENTLDAGMLGIHAGEYMAACVPFDITFHGRSSHAARPEAGIDAIAMAVKAYGAMRKAVEEEAGDRRFIWSVGSVHGGTAHNIICDRCDLQITFRHYDNEFANRVLARVKAICDGVAAEFGGSADVRWIVSAQAVVNDEDVVRSFSESVRTRGLPLVDVPPKMSAEDFSWYLTRVPGAFFRFGTRNESLGCTSTAHHADFRIDESGMRTAIEAFVAFVLDYGRPKAK